MKAKVLILFMMGLFAFSGCSTKSEKVRYVSTPCPTLQIFDEVNSTLPNSISIDVVEINETIQSTGNMYRDSWMVKKIQIQNLFLYVGGIKGALADSLFLNNLYSKQILEYNKLNTEKEKYGK